jgi:hypothetical protein
VHGGGGSNLPPHGSDFDRNPTDVAGVASAEPMIPSRRCATRRPRTPPDETGIIGGTRGSLRDIVGNRDLRAKLGDARGRDRTRRLPVHPAAPSHFRVS